MSTPSRALAGILPAKERRIPFVRSERGRTLILWGWLVTMLGVGLYCREVFSLGPEADALDAITRSGVLGWSSAILAAAGIFLWFMGNLLYLHDAMDTPAAAPAAPEDAEAPRG